MQVAYFGPAGTFTEEALLSQPDLAAGDRSPYPAVPEVIAAVERGDADGGVVPIENMIEGSVSVTLDTLAFDSELLIQREIDLAVSLNLCARPGAELDDLRTVVSFPHALAQCRAWLAKNLPDAGARASHSTSDAAREVSKSKDTDVAAICNALAAEIYGLNVLAREIEDHPENQTRFVLVGRGVPAPDRARQDVDRLFPAGEPAGIVAADPAGVRGAGINLSKLESRPTKRGLGDYCFFIDCEGHISDEVARRCAAEPGRQAGRGEVPRFVSRSPGSGPWAWPGARPPDARGSSAAAWVETLRAQIRETA